jgi:ATP-dependent protease ClpP protease subunit
MFPIAKKTNKHAEIKMYGDIGVWSEVSANRIKTLLADLKKEGYEKATFLVHSPGGSVFEGIAIKNIIANSEIEVEFIIEGIAASMATQIMLAGTKIKAYKDAKIMIHEAKSAVLGGANRLRSEAELLDKVNSDMAENYSQKTGKPKDWILQNWLKEGQARSEKNKALFDIAINTALAVVKAYAGSPLTFGLPFSAFALAQGAIQAAVVASRPIPKFKEGVEYLQGKGSTTSDSNLAWLSKGERVISAETNKKYFPVLSAIHNGKIKPEFLNNAITHNIKPEILAFKPQENKEVKILQKQVEKLTKALAGQPKADVNIDKNGFSVFLSDSLERQEVLNNRYSL